MVELSEYTQRYYDMVSEFYGDKTARRSGLPLMNHINEGIGYLRELYATETEISAWCIHPLFQNDGDLVKNFKQAGDCSGPVMLLVMEYRNIANKYLCRPETDHYTTKDLPAIPLDGVRRMLIADKRQNQKDFLEYHYGTHVRSEQSVSYTHLTLPTKA